MKIICIKLTILLVLLFLDVTFGAIFSWLFEGYGKSQESKHKNEKDDISSDTSCFVEDSNYAMSEVKIPFEISTNDEQFITEMSKYTSMDLTDLDICNHKVFLGLKTSCSDMTEEDISKVAVNLLNCQSAIEGRRIYLCTQQMELKDCTKHMDQNTWNAYHIMSNRVRAVCYQLRQQQFRAKTEMTVNKLIFSAEKQIGSMKVLEESHHILKDVTSGTLDALTTGHNELEKQQKELSSAQMNIRSYISSNLRELQREKRLIASGQKELARITMIIKKKLEEAQQQLEVQGEGQRNTHQKILYDLSEIQESASRVYSQLDKSTQKFMIAHDETISQYGKLMEDLNKMNSTVQLLTELLVKMRQKVEEKFSWLSTLLGDTDATVQKIYSFVLHICYCLLGMIASSFLQVPYATRLALIVLVPINALAEIKNESSLHFSTLSVVLAVCMFFNISSIGAVRVYHWHKSKKILKSNNKFIQSESCTTKESYVEKTQPFVSNVCNANDDYSSDDEQPDTKITKIYHNKNSRIGENSFSNGHLTDDRNGRIGGSPFSNEHLTDNRIGGSPFSNEHLTDNRNGRISGSPFSKEHLTDNRNGRIGGSPFSNEQFADNSPDVTKLNGNTNYSPDITRREISSTYHNQDFATEVRKRLLNIQHKSNELRNTINSSPNSVHLDTSNTENRGSRSTTPSTDYRFILNKSLTPKKFCSAICKSGLPCKNGITHDSSLCYRHINGSRESTPLL